MLNIINKIMGKSSSPKGGKRGCLGKDGKYAIENCNGELQEQGIGSLVSQVSSVIVNEDGSQTIVRSNG